MRGLEKNYMKRGHIYKYIYPAYINTHIDGHRDSMKESGKGRFFEKYQISPILQDPNCPIHKHAKLH